MSGAERVGLAINGALTVAVIALLVLELIEYVRCESWLM